MAEREILSILGERLSGLTARSLLDRCAASIGVRPVDLQPQHIPSLLRELEPGVRLFVPLDAQTEVLGRLAALGRPQNASQVIPVENEGDIPTTRAAARDLARDMGANAFATQKIVTATSELARNIVSHAGAGHLELVPSWKPRAAIRLIACDRGPGIANVDAVLTGRSKSKASPGRGLLAVRRLADAFDLKTGPRGTTVSAEFYF